MSKHTIRWPRVVACLPAFNAAEFITQTLEALEAQDYPNLEVLISDDASTDDTALICQSFAENSRTFRLIRQSHRLGWVNNVNALLAAAHAEYILITPHDDIIRPTYVTRLVQALEDNPHAVLAFSSRPAPPGHSCAGAGARTPYGPARKCWSKVIRPRTAPCGRTVETSPSRMVEDCLPARRAQAPRVTAQTRTSRR